MSEIALASPKPNKSQFIVLGAEYLSYVKSIETHARTFLPLNISAVGSVLSNEKIKFIKLERELQKSSVDN